MPRSHPLVIGHRGTPGYRPEHSRSSYDLALEMGVDAVEPDIVVSRDGVLVVRRAAYSMRSATSVVPEISFSWRTTSTPSRETTMSGSTPSTPIARARSYDERECSGR